MAYKENNNYENDEISVCGVWKSFENSRSYLTSIGLRSQVRKNIDFNEGRQWPEPTKETIGMPRPIINIVSFVVQNKLANIIGTPVRIQYTSSDDSDEIVKLNNFHRHWSKRQKFTKKLRELASRAAVDSGCAFHVPFYDNELHLEVIDELNVHVADPTSTESIQEQEWVIISSRKTVAYVKGLADEDVDLSKITADEEKLDQEVIEQDDTKLCTMLIRYFRLDGEVYFERAVKSTIVTKARPLAPDVEEVKKSELYKRIISEIDNDSTETVGEKTKKEKKISARLYPIAFWTYLPRRNCFYGRSEVEELIHDQKAINTSYGILLLGAQIEATGKTIVRHNALRNQTVSNNPMQVLTDYSPSGNGVYKLTSAQLNMAGATLVDNLIRYIRFTKGVTEVSTGEAYGANASGAAIAQLQSQANSTTSEVREQLWEMLEELGEIVLQGYKCFYAGGVTETYPYTQKVKARNDEGKDIERSLVKYDEFSGETFNLDAINTEIKAVKGTKSSTSGDIQMLESALNSKVIEFKEFLQLYPEEALTDKERLLQVVEAFEVDEKVQMAQALQQQSTQMQQMSDYLTKLMKAIEGNEKIIDSATLIIKADEASKKVAIEARAKQYMAQGANNALLEENKAQKAAMTYMAEDLLTMQPRFDSESQAQRPRAVNNVKNTQE